MKPSPLPHRPADHPSYQLHRKQVWTQILLPILLTVLILIAVIVLIYFATFGGNGDVARWAALSEIWLVMPVLVVGLIAFIILCGLIYLVIYVMNLIPPYSYQAQRIFYRIEGGARRISEMARRPVLLFQELGPLIKAYIAKARERI
ncbi:MAG: hypothetical protein HY258_10135 [Chloroflexi bacterium]|nr:hypothetical protein [Chloroflexota bacterium]